MQTEILLFVILAAIIAMIYSLRKVILMERKILVLEQKITGKKRKKK